MSEDHFGEPVAARYDATLPDMFSREKVEPVVAFLAELAGEARGAVSPPEARPLADVTDRLRELLAPAQSAVR